MVWGARLCFVWLRQFPTTLVWNPVLFLINFLCHFSTVHVLWQRRGLCQWQYWPDSSWCYPYLTVKCVTVFKALLDGCSICRIVSWSSRGTDSPFLEDVRLQSNKSEWRLAFHLPQADCQTAACQEVWGELGWRSVGTTNPTSRWAEGRNRWAIWWLAGTGQGFSVPVWECVCVCSINRLYHVVLGDHLSCGSSSSLSCVVSSTILAQPDTELCWDIAYKPLLYSLYQRYISCKNKNKKTSRSMFRGFNMSTFSAYVVM